MGIGFLARVKSETKIELWQGKRLQRFGGRCLTEGFMMAIGCKDAYAPLSLVHINTNE
jgi:hypothetical protein